MAVIATQSYPYLNAFKPEETEPMTSASPDPASPEPAPADPLLLTKELMRESVKSRIRTDEAFGSALFSEAIEVLLADDLVTAKSVLFDYIDATIGFEELSVQSTFTVETLREMFGPEGDPRAGELFRVLGVLQQHQGIQLEVVAAE